MHDLPALTKRPEEPGKRKMECTEIAFARGAYCSFLQVKGIAIPQPFRSYTTLEMGGEKENGKICHQNVDSCVPTGRTAYTPLLPVLSVFRQELL